jgi:hypothetical protein
MPSRATAPVSRISDTAEDIKRQLLKVPMVKKIDIYGKQAKKVYVEFSNERLAALGSRRCKRRKPPQPEQCAGKRADRHPATACSCASAANSRAWTIFAAFRSPPAAAREARRLRRSRADAKIRRVYGAPQRAAGADGRHHDDDDGNIVDFGKAIDEAVAKVRPSCLAGVELERVADQPTVVSESI